jgi:hypothetical protein
LDLSSDRLLNNNCVLTYAFHCTDNFETNYMAVSLPSKKNNYAANRCAHCLLYETYKIVTSVTKESQSISF